MHSKIKAEWLQNLRSGDWKEGTEYLANDELGAYCVFGVLAEMAAQHNICSRETNRMGIVEYDGSSQTLPESVKEWAGIEDDEAPVRDEDGFHEHSLYEMNDAGVTFDILADIIEEQM